MQSMNTNFTKKLEKKKVDWTNTCNDEKKSLKEDKIHIQSQNQNLSHTIKELEIEIGRKNNSIDRLNNNIKFTNFTIDQLETTIENLKGTKFVSVQYAIDHVFVTHPVLKVT